MRNFVIHYRLVVLLALVYLVLPVQGIALEFDDGYPEVSPADGVIASSPGEGKQHELTIVVSVRDVSAPVEYTISGAGVSRISTTAIEETFVITVDDIAESQNTRAELDLEVADDSGQSITETIVVLVDSIQPSTPEKVDASPGDGYARVFWDAPPTSASDATNAQSNIESYLIYYAMSSDSLRNSFDEVTGTGTAIDWEFFAAISDVATVSVPIEQYPSDGEIVGSETDEDLRLVLNQEYFFAVIPVDHAGNRGTVDDPDNQIAYATPTTYISADSLLALKDRCYLVSASLGNSRSPALTPYRFVRDEILLRTSWGTAFVHWYYDTAPPVAQWIAKLGTMRWLFFALVWLGAIALVAAPFAGIVLLAVGLRRWRALASTTAIVLVVSMAAGFGANAHAGDLDSWRPDDEIWRIGQNVSIKGLGYKPTFSGSTDAGISATDEDIWGANRSPMFGVNYGVELLRAGGLLSLQVGGRFWIRDTKEIDIDGNATSVSESTTIGAVDLSVGYAFQYIFPQYIVPYVEGGISFWGLSTPKDDATDDNTRTQATFLGWRIAGELRLLLDWMDPAGESRILDNFGIRDTHIAVGYSIDKMITGLKGNRSSNSPLLTSAFPGFRQTLGLNRSSFYAAIVFQF